MMGVSQKCQYALRAIIELARRYGNGTTSIREIAQVQAIPPKFLELILTDLRKGGFVDSRRGAHGGYILAMGPEAISVGQIIRLIDGPVAPVRCVGDRRGGDCPLYGERALMGMWGRARDAVTEVYDSTTIQDLVDAQQVSAGPYVASYCI